MKTKLVLLGTGTPNACPWASGPASAVVVDDHAYLVDFGPGVVRQAAEAYRQGIAAREPKWQTYHRAVHTLSTDLAALAQKAQPKRLVTYHCIYHMNIQDNTVDVQAEAERRSDAILDEIRAAGYDGPTVSGNDLDVFEV